MKQSKKKARKAAAPKGPPPRVLPLQQRDQEEGIYRDRMMRAKP